MLSETFCKWCDSGGGGVGMEIEVRAATEMIAVVRSVAAATASSSSHSQVFYHCVYLGCLYDFVSIFIQ